MDQELFNPQSSSVTSFRILYTPSTFARTSLLHLQEVESLQAMAHTPGSDPIKTDFEEIVRLDTEYISEWHIGLDIKILFMDHNNLLKNRVRNRHNKEYV